jgi:hypothetical protein
VSSPTPKKRENLFLNLICNIAIPTIVLTKLSTDAWLGPQWGMIVALAFPFGYGVYDLIQRKKTNIFSIIGIASVLLTGGLNQMKAETHWFAIKEAAIPGMLCITVLISSRTKRPFIRELLWNDQVIDTERVDAILNERGQHDAFESLLRRASFGLALAFLLSAALNYGLARYLLKSPAGTPEFNAELGRMNLLSWPVITLPFFVAMMIVMWRLLTGMTALTGLELEQIFRGAEKKKESGS